MVKRGRKEAEDKSSVASGKKRARNKNSTPSGTTMRLSAEKKSKIAQFLSISGGGGQISESAAQAYLNDCGWSIEVALNQFFTDGGAKARSMGAGGSHGGRVSVPNIEAAFNKYATSGNNSMDAEQLFKFCEDLGINPAEDPVILVILHLMGVESMESIELKYWIDGFKKMGVDSVDSLKKKLDFF